MTTIAAPETTGTIQRMDGYLSYRNPLMQVETDQVRFPDGTTGHYSKVTAGTGLGVVAVPVASFGGQVYLGLVQQHRYPVDEHTLEFPRGGAEDLGRDEAARELFEETGLFYESATRIGVIKPDTGLLTTRIAVWQTNHRISSVEVNHLEDVTGATARWYNHDDVTRMIREGRISCGITLAAMALLAASGVLDAPIR